MAEASSFAQLQFTSPPDAVLKVQREYYGASERQCPNGNFLKGVAWSPDGACLLSASDDSRLRVFDLPPDVLEARSLGNATESSLDGIARHEDTAQAPLTVQEGELIYDYAWYSGMLASDPASCCFATTARAHPIHLWDACTGELRCTYRPYDDKDEVTAANSLAFSPDGSKLAAGASKMLRVFDTAVPGRSCRWHATFTRKQGGQPGILSTLAYNPDRSGVIAAGAYSGVAALYDEQTLAPLALLEAHRSGITQVQWSPDGNFLYTGARQDADILCWDIRNTSAVLYAMQRDTRSTNQRIQFSIEPCGRHLATGGSDGHVRVFDLVDGSQAAEFQLAHDTVNGFLFHPFLPLAAAASGQRRFPAAPSDGDSSDDDDIRADDANQQQRSERQQSRIENALLLWRFDCVWPAATTENPNPVQELVTADAAEITQAASTLADAVMMEVAA